MIEKREERIKKIDQNEGSGIERRERDTTMRESEKRRLGRERK